MTIRLVAAVLFALVLAFAIDGTSNHADAGPCDRDPDYCDRD